MAAAAAPRVHSASRSDAFEAPRDPSCRVGVCSGGPPDSKRSRRSRVALAFSVDGEAAPRGAQLVDPMHYRFEPYMLAGVGNSLAHLVAEGGFVGLAS